MPLEESKDMKIVFDPQTLKIQLGDKPGLIQNITQKMPSPEVE